MKDNIVIGLDANIRIYVAKMTDTVEEARRRHNLYPVASAALGRTMTATAIMGAMLKNNETIVSIINGGGPIGTVMAEANAAGECRGYVGQPSIHVQSNQTGKLAVGHAVGKTGYLQVIKDLKLKEPFTGQVQMVNGEIAEEFTKYFAASEQVPSVVSLGVLVEPDNHVSHAGGFVIQLLPEHTEEDIVKVENAIKDISQMSKLLSDGLTTEDIMKLLLPDAKLLDTRDVFFECQCTKEKMSSAILAAGADEIESMIKEDGQCEITCTYCGENLIFDKKELTELLNKFK